MIPLTVTRENMTVDLMIWDAMKRSDAAIVEATFAANPGLAEHGPVLPVGTVIYVPDLPTSTVKPTVRLWD